MGETILEVHLKDFDLLKYIPHLKVTFLTGFSNVKMHPASVELAKMQILLRLVWGLVWDSAFPAGMQGCCSAIHELRRETLYPAIETSPLFPWAVMWPNCKSSTLPLKVKIIKMTKHLDQVPVLLTTFYSFGIPSVRGWYGNYKEQLPQTVFFYPKAKVTVWWL